jgi:DNA processing protein
MAHFVVTREEGEGVCAESGLDALRLAIAVGRYGHASRRLGSPVRQQEAAAQGLYQQLTTVQQDDIECEMRAMQTAGIGALLIGQEGYPVILESLRQAPRVLFYRGDRELLGMRSIGICGSRDATSQGLSAAQACGEEIAECDLVVVSGYARGVDTEAHSAALDTGGRTVMVLAEGIRRFKIKRWLASKAYGPHQVAVVSQFAPSQAWSVGAAMTRNSVIIGLSLGLVVIEAREIGGTLAAGLRALDEKRPVLALEFRKDMPQGNKILLDQGAIPVRSRSELRERLQQLRSGTHPGQLTLM